MTFVTRLTLQSGDRDALDGTVDDIKTTAERKGAALKGPHSHPPEKFSVPQHQRLHADDERQFSSWTYTVFTRELEIHGHDASRETSPNGSSPTRFTLKSKSSNAAERVEPTENEVTLTLPTPVLLFARPANPSI